MNSGVHIPYLSEDEKIFLNTTATYSQARRMSNHIDRQSIDTNTHNRRGQLSFLWKRRESSSCLTISSAESNEKPSIDCNQQSCYPTSSKSPKARELESLIFDQPQRTVRLSLTPRCAV